MNSVIYFLSDGGRAIKIGTSKSVGDRLRQVQAMHPVEIEFLGSTPGTFRHEAEIHRRLAKHRLRGEWFVDCRAVRDLMTAVLRDGTASMKTKFRDRSSCEDAFVTQCVDICALLIKREKSKGHSTAEAIENVAAATGLSRGKIWQFRYRPPRAVHSHELHSIRQAGAAVALHTTEIEITKAIAGPAHAAVGAAEALVAASEKEVRDDDGDSSV